jgi:glucose/mannose-6-phosphate isomerase
MAFFELFPELNHNAVVGYEFPAKVRERIFVVLLHSGLLHPRNQLRYEATAKLLAKAGIGYEFVEAAGKSALPQALSLILLGDYTSFYLAMLNKVDPTPVASIDFLKEYLARFE